MALLAAAGVTPQLRGSVMLADAKGEADGGMVTLGLEGARRSLHRLLDGVMPITYTRGECVLRKRALDPNGPRSKAAARKEAAVRAGRLVEVLGMPPAALQQYVQEAASVELVEVPPDAQPLASPMSYEDRFLLYVVSRAVRPRLAVETGVANGCSAAMTLAAMQRNDFGSLIGIDAAAVAADLLGRVIPHGLRARFTLRLGDAIKQLRAMHDAGMRIGQFLHDSDHRYRHARAEYELAWDMLEPGGVLCSHDVLCSNAFSRFVAARRGEVSAAAAVVNLGVARKS